MDEAHNCENKAEEVKSHDILLENVLLFLRDIESLSHPWYQTLKAQLQALASLTIEK